MLVVIGKGTIANIFRSIILTFKCLGLVFIIYNLHKTKMIICRVSIKNKILADTRVVI